MAVYNRDNINYGQLLSSMVTARANALNASINRHNTYRDNIAKNLSDVAKLGGKGYDMYRRYKALDTNVNDVNELEAELAELNKEKIVLENRISEYESTKGPSHDLNTPHEHELAPEQSYVKTEAESTWTPPDDTYEDFGEFYRRIVTENDVKYEEIYDKDGNLVRKDPM